MIKASGRALIPAAVMVLFLAGAAQAAPDAPVPARSDGASKPAEAAKYTKHRRHYARRHHASKTAQASSEDKVDKKDPAVAETVAPASSSMPLAVANANAQVVAAETPAATENTVPAQVPGNQVVGSDQLNDVDRALQEDNPPAQKTVIAAVDAQPPQSSSAGPVAAPASSESSTWEQTSLIGKIFIGFGALLTLASAARMFMA